jgi:Flp pilus assembly protein CpaB
VATEVKQRNNRIIMVVLGLVLAAAAFGLSLYVSKSGSSTGSGSSQQITVVVAKTDLAQGTQLTPDVLTTKQYSADSAPVGSVNDPTTLLKKYLTIAVTQNTPITANMLVVDAASAKTAALSLTPLDIHKGNVALAIPVGGQGGNNSFAPELFTFGLYVQPDDHIDMLVDDGRGNVRYAFQDLRVLKVSSYSASGTATTPNVLVIEASRGEAEAISWLLEHSGVGGNNPTIIKYVLRPKDSATSGPTPNYVDTPPFNAPNKQDQPVNSSSFNQLFPAH